MYSVAIMQPYFIPYAGYFRLLRAADLFVIYDCVQFQRRGWMHRNQLRLKTGETDWFTLPIEKAPREVVIRDLRFRATAEADLNAQVTRFPALASPPERARQLVELICQPIGRPVDYIVETLRVAAEMLELPWRTRRSSELALPDSLRGQERILAIAKAFGAARYVNPPGGRSLYDAARFAEEGIDLQFLTDYAGSHDSIAQRLCDEEPERVANEIAANTVCTAATGATSPSTAL